MTGQQIEQRKKAGRKFNSGVIMITEEDRKEAKEYAHGMTIYYESAHDGVPSQLEKYLKNAYIAGIEAMKERIAELEKENAELKENLYAKAIMREVLDNATEYSRQIAEDFIAEGTK